jgi:hypothetical protein
MNQRLSDLTIVLKNLAQVLQKVQPCPASKQVAYASKTDQNASNANPNSESEAVTYKQSMNLRY